MRRISWLLFLSLTSFTLRPAAAADARKAMPLSPPRPAATQADAIGELHGEIRRLQQEVSAPALRSSGSIRRSCNRSRDWPAVLPRRASWPRRRRLSPSARRKRSLPSTIKTGRPPESRLARRSASCKCKSPPR